VLDGEVWAPTLGIRRRADGGYTIAHGASFLHRLTPDTLRFATKFLGLYRGTDSMRVQVDGEFVHALALPAQWPLDAPTPFERQRVLDPGPEQHVLAQIRAELKQWFPEIADAPFVETWGGMIEASPDALPIISESDRIAGFYVATGFSGHGFGIGPGAGRFVADLVQGRAGPAELDSFRLSRYFDGTPIRPGPSL
jgi:glycine/D-amino acid oxidase-like deaminating enzyme